MPGEDEAPAAADERRPGDAAAVLREAIDEMAAAVARSVQPLALAVAGMARALAADPLVAFVMDHPELLAVPRPKPCWCLCGVAHPGKAVCDGEGVAIGTVVVKPYGPVPVQWCRPCAAAHGITVTT